MPLRSVLGREKAEGFSESKNVPAAQYSSLFSDNQGDVHGGGIGDMSLVDTVTCCGA